MLRSRKAIARRRRLTALTIAAGLLLLLFLWVRVQSAERALPDPLQRLLVEVVAPSIRMSGKLRNWVHRDPTPPAGDRTPTAAARLQELEQENKELRDLLTLRDTRFSAGIAAEVIGRTLESWDGSLMLDRGARDGIRLQMIVLVPEGVVGRIIEVNRATSKVLLLTDPASGIGAKVSRSRALGVLKGTRTGRCQLHYLSGSMDVREGDLVTTSSYSSLYPAGLPLGTVLNVEEVPALSARVATVRPSVDPAQLEMVLVVAGAP